MSRRDPCAFQSLIRQGRGLRSYQLPVGSGQVRRRTLVTGTWRLVIPPEAANPLFVRDAIQTKIIRAYRAARGEK